MADDAKCALQYHHDVINQQQLANSAKNLLASLDDSIMSRFWGIIFKITDHFFDHITYAKDLEDHIRRYNKRHKTNCTVESVSKCLIFL